MGVRHPLNDLLMRIVLETMCQCLTEIRWKYWEENLMTTHQPLPPPSGLAGACFLCGEPTAPWSTEILLLLPTVLTVRVSRPYF